MSHPNSIKIAERTCNKIRDICKRYRNGCKIFETDDIISKANIRLQSFMINDILSSLTREYDTKMMKKKYESPTNDKNSISMNRDSNYVDPTFRRRINICNKYVTPSKIEKPQEIRKYIMNSNMSASNLIDATALKDKCYTKRELLDKYDYNVQILRDTQDKLSELIQNTKYLKEQAEMMLPNTKAKMTEMVKDDYNATELFSKEEKKNHRQCMERVQKDIKDSLIAYKDNIKYMNSKTQLISNKDSEMPCLMQYTQNQPKLKEQKYIKKTITFPNNDESCDELSNCKNMDDKMENPSIIFDHEDLDEKIELALQLNLLQKDTDKWRIFKNKCKTILKEMTIDGDKKETSELEVLTENINKFKSPHTSVDVTQVSEAEENKKLRIAETMKLLNSEKAWSEYSSDNEFEELEKNRNGEKCKDSKDTIHIKISLANGKKIGTTMTPKRNLTARSRGTMESSISGENNRNFNENDFQEILSDDSWEDYDRFSISSDKVWQDPFDFGPNTVETTQEEIAKLTLVDMKEKIQNQNKKINDYEEARKQENNFNNVSIFWNPYSGAQTSFPVIEKEDNMNEPSNDSEDQEEMKAIPAGEQAQFKINKKDGKLNPDEQNQFPFSLDPLHTPHIIIRGVKNFKC